MYILRRGNEFQMTIFAKAWDEVARLGKSAGQTHARYLYDRKIDDIVLRVVRIDDVTITLRWCRKIFGEADDFSLLTTVDYAP